MSIKVRYKQIYNTLKQAHNVLVVSHPRCGDALGSTLAFGQLLSSMQKKYTLYTHDDIPQELQFLPYIHEVVVKDEDIKMADFDVVLIVDANRHMTGINDKIEHEIDETRTTIINIDHHVTNKGEGDINIIDVDASSTTFLIYNFFVDNGLPISRDIATCLLVGILYDTGNFSNSATNDAAIEVASELMNTGAPLTMITDALIVNKKIDSLRMWGSILARIEHNEAYDIVHTTITRDDYEEHAMEASAGEIANFLNGIADGSFNMIMKESEDGLIKVSLRTTHDTVDVAKFAQYFGGGGHKKAAGFALKGQLVYNERTKKYRIV
ncbi:MAG: DHH family phosphoesterase [Patescibacteria group bacterium]